MSNPAEHTQLTPPIGERDHSQGSARSPITLVQYGDYECPYSGQAYTLIRELQGQLGDGLRYVFRNFPLSHVHPHAQHAAEAAEAADAQGAFWPMHDYLFTHQQRLDDGQLLAAARAVGLDRARFEADMTVHRHAARVREDHAGGERSGVIGTPTFFVNGIRQGGPADFEVMLAAIQRAVDAAGE